MKRCQASEKMNLDNVSENRIKDLTSLSVQAGNALKMIEGLCLKLE